MKIHKNIGTFEDNRMVYHLYKDRFYYMRGLCNPQKEFGLFEVDLNDCFVTCKKCLKIMRKDQ